MKLLIFCILLTLSRANIWESYRFCKFEVRGPIGFLTSANFPRNLPLTLTCSVKITVPPDYIVRLHLTEINLGWNGTNKDGNDSLTIFDGDDDSFEKIDVIHGSDKIIPKRSYDSSVNYLYLEYKQHQYTEPHEGFHGIYREVYVGCSDLIRSNGTVIKHPRVSDTYTDYETCYWLIQAPPGHIIEFNWSKFNTKDSDWVSITEWVGDTLEERFRHSGGYLPKPVNSTTSNAKLHFESDRDFVATGFSVTCIFHNVSNLLGH